MCGEIKVLKANHAPSTCQPGHENRQTKRKQLGDHLKHNIYACGKEKCPEILRTRHKFGNIYYFQVNRPSPEHDLRPTPASASQGILESHINMVREDTFSMWIQEDQ